MGWSFLFCVSHPPPSSRPLSLPHLTPHTHIPLSLSLSLSSRHPSKAVFRDDIVFCVYLYQRWAYRVDRTRPNEYGFAAEPAPSEVAGGAGAVAEGEVVGQVTGVAAGAGAVRRRGGASAADPPPPPAGEGGDGGGEVKKEL